MSAIDSAGLPPPLSGEAKRQAMDSILGYDYQIWRTVEAWMLLNSGETLFIECAEDFDVIQPAGAAMTQLKNSPTPITINSGDVKDAIQNFWIAKNKNTNRGRIVLRFLTRGEIGHERDRPFADEKGLELWQTAAAGDETAATRLASHLATTLTNASLVEFFGTARGPELIEQLFSCIEWVTGEPSMDAVQLAVKRMAIQLGEVRNVTALVSAGAVNALLAKCRDTAVKKEAALRSLSLEELQLVFEGSTSLPIPITGDFLAQISAMLAPKAAGPSFVLSFSDGGLPLLPQPHLPRQEFVLAVANSLIESPAVLIVGSEGRGKTTVANIVGHGVTGAVHWIDLSMQTDDLAVASALESAILKVRGPQPPRCMILDDVPVAQGISDHVWIPLRALMESCKQFKSVLLLTAKGVAEDAVDSKFRTARVKVMSVPGLAQTEVEEFFTTLGCPEDRLANWAKLTLLQSGNGHPKLVYLRGLELCDANWPAVTGDAVVAAPASIEEARSSTRQVAAKVVGDTDRPLLYTLSLSVIPFDRAVALNLGAMLSLQAPGESFDRLAGRWIESRGRGRLNVTTMLNGQAQKIWTVERVNEAHQMLFDAFINRKTIGVDEAWGVFLHAFAGKDPNRLGRFLGTLIGENLEKADRLAEALEFLLHLGSASSTFAVPFDRRCSIILRIIQFRIAKTRRVNALTDIVEKWAWEISQIPEGEEKEAARVIRGLSIACTMEGDLSPATVVGALHDAAGFEKMGLALDVPFFQSTIADSSTSTVPLLAWLFAAAQTRCNTIVQLDQFLLALDDLPVELRDQMLESFEAPYERMGLSMIERVWLAENKKELQDWPAVINSLERAGGFAKKWSCKSLMAVVAKTLSIIYDEQIGDRAEALEVLRIACADGPVALLQDQEANVKFRAGDFDGALELWRQALYGEGESPGCEEKRRDQFAMRKAGNAAATLGFFDEAGMWMQRAAETALQREAGVPPAAFYLDASYCWFKSGDVAKAVDALNTATVLLKDEYDAESEFFKFAAQKNAGNLALWMLGQLRSERDGTTEPWAGSSGNPELDRAGYQSLPASPYIITACMILEIAHLVRFDSSRFIELRADLARTTNVVAGMKFRILRLRESIEHRKLGNMAICVRDLQVAIWTSLDAMSTSSAITAEFSKEVPEEMLSKVPVDAQWLFAIGLVLRTIVGGSPETLAAEWNGRLKGMAYGEKFQSALMNLVTIFDMAGGSASAKMRVSPPSFSNLGAAATLLASDRRTPNDTAYAQVALLLWFERSPARMFVDSTLELFFEAFAGHWRQHLSAPALLINPRVAVPMLDQAISRKGPVADRLLNLLMVACSASGTGIPRSLMEHLAKYSENRKLADVFTQDCLRESS